MRRKQQAIGQFRRSFRHRGANLRRHRGDEALIGRDSSRCGSWARQDRPCFAAWSQSLKRRRGGGGGELRIERQKHDAVRRELPHRLRRRIAERMPAAHGDEGPGLEPCVRNARFQSLGLALGFLQDRRAAAQMAIDLARNGARRLAMNRASGMRTIAGREMIAGSENRLRRNGSTASGLSGPPRLNRTIPNFTREPSKQDS